MLRGTRQRQRPGSAVLKLLPLLLLLPALSQGFLLMPPHPPHPRRILQRAQAEAHTPSSSSFEPVRTPEALRTFEAWLRQDGPLDLSSTPLALQLTGPAITLRTTRPIERDQIVLAIPQSLLLTTALPPRLATAAAQANLDPLGRLALRLLAEAAKAAGGPWWAYLRVLPRREDMHLPILWDDDEEEGLLSLLAPSPLYDDIVECRGAMRNELEALRSALSEDKALLGLLDWRHWTWARAIAMSRPYILDPDEQHQQNQGTDPARPSSLTLIPVVDMADHSDDVKYGVQRGDGVFTSRTDVQLVADRGMPFWNTYGPGLSSASKLYSFGYLDSISLGGDSDGGDGGEGGAESFALGGDGDGDGDGGGEGATVPLQGTALFVVGLKAEGEEDPETSRAKAAILAQAGLAPQDQRLEVATRTRVTGPGLAMVAIEDHVTAPGLLTGEGEWEGVVDGGVERLMRYLRLKHLPPSGVVGLEGQWARLGSARHRCGRGIEMAAALEAVALCQAGLRRVGPQLARVEEVEGGGRHRVGLVRTLLNGEILALRAVAEWAMAAVEAAEMEGGG